MVFTFPSLASINEGSQPSGIPIPTKRKLTSAKSLSSLHHPDDSGNLTSCPQSTF